MKVVLRVDASVQIGSGHVMRCSTLAHQLQQSGVEAIFLCRNLVGNYCDWLQSRSLQVMTLSTKIEQERHGPADASGATWSGSALDRDIRNCREILDRMGQVDWVVVDHYALDARWEEALRRPGRKVMAIDDLANRNHDCDLLLDQNLQKPGRYQTLVPSSCRQLIGPNYALLRSQFASARERLMPRARKVSRLLVFFGGADANADTLKALAAIRRLDRTDLAFDVVIGQPNPYRETIETICQEMPNTKLHCQVEDMAALMVRADLFVGSGGSASWERCCVGLPSLVLAVAENQVEQSLALAEAGAQIYIGRSSDVSQDQLMKAVSTAIASTDRLAEMSQLALQLVDGRGAGRVASEMIA